MADGSLACELHHRPRSADLPMFEFSSDDALAFHMVTNTIHCYETASFASGPTRRLHIKGIASYGVAPAAQPHVAVFVPEVKGSPAHVALYAASAFTAGSNESTVPQAIARKAFFRVGACCTHQHVLLCAQFPSPLLTNRPMQCAFCGTAPRPRSLRSPCLTWTPPTNHTTVSKSFTFLPPTATTPPSPCPRYAVVQVSHEG